MKYLQIPEHVINYANGLYDLIFPDDATVEHEYIIYGQIYMVPETHPNITFIMLRLKEHQWYNDDSGPVRFIRYA